MNNRYLPLKRSLDLIAALLLFLVLFPLLILLWLACSFDTRSNGLFLQLRLGQSCSPFFIFKFKTMVPSPQFSSSFPYPHGSKGKHITRLGQFLRRTKIDELPQLFNILLGQMSFVGPRPDVPGYLDSLQHEDIVVQQLTPGISSLASIVYAGEEYALAAHSNPKLLNDTVIWPRKVALNKYYANHQSALLDTLILLSTISPVFYRLLRFFGFANISKLQASAYDFSSDELFRSLR